jgi:Zn-dependent protease
MLIGGVPPTPYDLNFSLLRIPVRVHPLFWLAALLLGMNQPPRELVIWVPVVFVSILVHEMGHALVIRQFGWWPSILLYTFGGLAIYNPTRRNPRKQMVISLAGPAAGFLVAGALIAIFKLRGHPVTFLVGAPYGIIPIPPDLGSQSMNVLVYDLLTVNIWWGLMNLLPVYPLDGGQFLYALFETLRVPDSLVKSLWVSIFTGAAVAIYAVARLHDYYIAALFGYLAFTSFQTLQAFTGRGGGYGGW